jgi:hypothetical protein
MNLRKYVLLASLFMILPCLIGAQQSREEGVKAIESKLLDGSDAPYKLNASQNGRGYEFCNRSAVQVVRFRLGCVDKMKDELKIISKRPFDEAYLPPGDEKRVWCKFWSSNHGFFPGEACKRGKLAIIEVDLANDTVWKLKS